MKSLAQTRVMQFTSVLLQIEDTAIAGSGVSDWDGDDDRNLCIIAAIGYGRIPAENMQFL